jgi:hypothetical protein
MANLGGPFNGYSPQQTILNYKSSEQSMTRNILRRSWNTAYASGTYNGYSRRVGPFRAVTSNGDFLNRINYSCGGSNQVTPDRYKRGNNIGSLRNACDGTGVPAGQSNGRFVPDSSDYTRFRKQMAMNQNYNDSSNGGDQSNGSYVFRLAARRY